MRQTLSLILLLLCCFIGFTGYCFALIDWVRDVQTGVYERNHLEAIYETLALLVYTYFAVRFAGRRINL
jgi:hypothetical protein